jgi:hypothetical protein
MSGTRILRPNIFAGSSLSYPGGGGVAPFVPSGSPYVRYDASQLEGFSNNDPVSPWPDLIGSRDLAKTQEERRPLYILDGQNGLPILRFDGDDDNMICEIATFGTISQPTTVFFVFKLYVSAPANQYPFSSRSGAASQHIGIRISGAFGDKWSLESGGSFLSNDHAPDTSWHIHTAQFNNLNSVYRIDGANEVTGATGTEDMSGLVIGSSAADVNETQIDVGEIIIYSGLESVAANEAGLMTKWGIS